jgi:pimeloyl-ACP methyl ester carboxylesterase
MKALMHDSVSSVSETVQAVRDSVTESSLAIRAAVRESTDIMRTQVGDTISAISNSRIVGMTWFRASVSFVSVLMFFVVPVSFFIMSVCNLDELSFGLDLWKNYRGAVYLWGLGLWAFGEALFAFFMYFVVAPKLHELRPLPTENFEPIQLMEKVLHAVDILDSYSIENMLRGYFLDASISQIRIGNLASFVAWAIFQSTDSNLSEEDRGKLEEMVTMLVEYCQKQGLEFEAGYNPTLRHVSMTIEPVNFIHRPLLLYAIRSIVYNVLEFWAVSVLGFVCHSHAGLRYWHRPRKGCDENDTNAGESPTRSKKKKAKKEDEEPHRIPGSQTPLVFFHGICSGWLSYCAVIRALLANGEREMILVELDAIRINTLCFDMPSVREFSDAVKAILGRHSIKQVSLVGHSFGSITAAWFVKSYPACVQHLTLLDPVSILLSLPDVAYNFLYRAPSTLSEKIIYYMASREVTVAHMLHRHFWWHQNILWLEDLPARIGVVVGLAEKDEVTNPMAQLEYVAKMRETRERMQQQQSLKEDISANSLNCTGEVDPADHIGSIEAVFFPGFAHGSALRNDAMLSKLLAAIRRSEGLLGAGGNIVT